MISAEVLINACLKLFGNESSIFPATFRIRQTLPLTIVVWITSSWFLIGMSCKNASEFWSAFYFCTVGKHPFYIIIQQKLDPYRQPDSSCLYLKFCFGLKFCGINILHFLTINTRPLRTYRIPDIDFCPQVYNIPIILSTIWYCLCRSSVSSCWQL